MRKLYYIGSVIIILLLLVAKFTPTEHDTADGFDGQNHSVLIPAVIVAYDSTNSHGEEYLVRYGNNQTNTGVLYSYKFSVGDEVYLYEVYTLSIGDNSRLNRFLIDKEVGDMLIARGSAKLQTAGKTTTTN